MLHVQVVRQLDAFVFLSQLSLVKLDDADHGLVFNVREVVNDHV